MSWSHILAFVIGVSVTIGGYETNRMFAQPTARAAIAQKNAPQKKKSAKPLATAAAKKKAATKRKKAAASAAKKTNTPVTDPDGRARRQEARAEAGAAGAEPEAAPTEAAEEANE